MVGVSGMNSLIVATVLGGVSLAGIVAWAFWQQRDRSEKPSAANNWRRVPEKPSDARPQDASDPWSVVHGLDGNH